MKKNKIIVINILVLLIIEIIAVSMMFILKKGENSSTFGSSGMVTERAVDSGITTVASVPTVDFSNTTLGDYLIKNCFPTGGKIGLSMELYNRNMNAKKIGDVNLDGAISSSDLAYIYSAYCGNTTLSDQAKINADVDENGIVDCVDAAKLYNYVGNTNYGTYGTGNIKDDDKYASIVADGNTEIRVYEFNLAEENLKNVWNIERAIGSSDATINYTYSTFGVKDLSGTTIGKVDDNGALTLNEGVSGKGKIYAVDNDELYINIVADSEAQIGTTEYLVDKVQIGDYVNIGIDYINNAQNFKSEYVEGDYSITSSGPYGWRVLSKNGSGKTGTVTLVTGGSPLRFIYYYPHTKYIDLALQMLDDLYKTVEILDSDAWRERPGFDVNGFNLKRPFSSTNLQSIFSGCTYIDTTKGVHALKTEEVETAYETLTGSRKTIQELESMPNALQTSKMKEVNPNFNTRANNLLGIGSQYWLGGAKYDSSKLWQVRSNCDVIGTNQGSFDGVRPVVTLKPGVEISAYNIGDGSSEKQAWNTESESNLTVDPNGGSVQVTPNGQQKNTINFSQKYKQNGGTTLSYEIPSKSSETTKETYTITFDYNGSEQTQTANTATKTVVTEYTFSKWKKSEPFHGTLSNESGSGTYTFGATDGTNDTITAQYSSSTSTNTTEVTLPTPQEKEGYDFAGWWTTPDGGGERIGNANDKYTPSKTETLYAHWTPKTYIIELNVNDGIPLLTKTITVECDATYGKHCNGGELPEPTREGYKFAGWYTEAINGTLITKDTKVQEPVPQTLYAHWTANTYELEIKPNGGTWGNKTDSSIVTGNYESTYKVSNPTPPAEYTVSFDANAEGIENPSLQKSIREFTEWTHSGEGNWNKATSTYTYGEGKGILTANYTERNSIILPDITREGYKFAGWWTERTNGNKRGDGNESYTPEKTETLYAHWIANTYTVKYNGNGATEGETGDSHHTYDQYAPLTENGYKRKYTVTYNHNYDGSSNRSEIAEYTFDGWSKTKEGNKEFNDGQTVKNLTEQNNGELTLYAKWISVSVNYTPTREGYIFGGWYRNADCSNQVTNAEDTTYTPETDIELFAKWTANEYTVQYDGNRATEGETGDSHHTYNQYAPLTENGYKRKYTVTYNHNYEGSEHHTEVAEYEFEGWAQTREGEKEFNDGQDVINLTVDSGGIVTLYAKWIKNSVSYTPTRTGYTFGGWYSEANCANQVTSVEDTTYTPEANIELFAKWTANTYELTFDANPGTDPIQPSTPNPERKTVTYDQTYGDLAEISRYSFNFIGWFTEREGGREVTESTLVQITEPQTLYAHWAPILVSRITIDPAQVSLNEGEKEKLTEIIEPVDAHDKTVTWTSSDTKVVTVDENGIITAQQEGTAQVTAKANDGSEVQGTSQIIVTKELDDDTKVKITKLEIQPNEATIDLSSSTHTQRLTTKILPLDATNTSVIWTSSNKEIAEVDQNGLVTGLKEGDVTITAVAKDGSDREAAAIIHVIRSGRTDEKVTKLEIYPEPVVIINLANANPTKWLAAMALPEYASNKEVTWESENGEVAEINEEGLVTAVAEGETIVTAIAKDGSNVKATRKVVVINRQEGEDIIEVTGIKIEPEEATIDLASETKTRWMTTVITPTNASNKEVIWVSSDENVAKIDANGKVTGVSVGKVTITAIAKYGNGTEATAEIEVINSGREPEEDVPVTSMEILPEESTIDLSSETITQRLVIKALPVNARNQEVTWESSNGSIAEVDETGLVTGLQEGEVLITAVAKHGEGVRALAKVKVVSSKRGENVLVNRIEIQPKEATIYLSRQKPTQQLIVNVFPRNAKNKNVTWISSNSEVASVNSKGLVTGWQEGTVTITAVAKDGSGIQDTAKITVNNSNTRPGTLVEGMYIVPELAIIDLSSDTKTQTLATVITPEDASNQEVEWNSSDESIATVSKTGEVSGIQEGEVTITAKATDGSGVTAQRKVSIINTPQTNTVKAMAVNVYPKEVTIDISSDSLERWLTAEVLPDNASNKEVLWRSSDPSIAEVDVNGKVVATGDKEGEVTVTAIAKYGEEVQGTSKVIVVDGYEGRRKVEGIYIEPEPAIIDLSSDTKTLRLVGSVTPASANNQQLEWSISNENIATIDENGLVKGKAEGEVIVTAKSTDGTDKEAQRKVSIINTPGGDFIGVTSLQVYPKKSVIDLASDTKVQELTTTALPQDATNKEVLWRSSNPEIAEVDESGRVTATGNKEGKVLVTAIAKYGNRVQDTSEVEIIHSRTPASSNVKVEDINVLPSTSVIELVSMTHYQKLVATIKPDNAKNKGVTWSLDDEEIATIDENGVVTATGNKEGTVVVTALAKDGSGVKATAKVTVVKSTQREEVKVGSISVLPSESTIDLSSKTKTQQLTAVITPNNAKNKEVTWKSSDTSVAVVSTSGLVIGIKESDTPATITAEAKDGSGIQATAIVHVTDSHTVEDTKVEGIYIHPEPAIIDLSSDTKTIQLAPVVSPTNATDKSLEWSCSNEEKARVDRNGKVTGLQEGEVIITAKATDGSGVTARRKVTIINTPKTMDVEVIKIYVEPEETVIDLSSNTKTKQLTTKVVPNNASNKELIWRSNNPEVAEVDKNGEVTGIAEGTATITAMVKYSNEIQGTAKVEVIDSHTTTDEKVQSIEILPELAIIDLASTTTTLQLVTQVEPSSATNKDVEWSSSDESIGTVDENGLVTGLREGEVSITAKAKDGSKVTATRKVSVINTPKGNLILASKVQILPKESTIDLASNTKVQELTVVVTPQDATNKEVLWRSSNPSIAEVDENGRVVGYKKGTVTITAIAKYGNEAKDTAKITVVQSKGTAKKIEKINVLPSVSIIDLASNTTTQKLVVQVTPTNAKNKEVEWSSSDEGIATVDENGVVTGLKEGTVLVTAKAKDGSGIESTGEVTVVRSAKREEVKVSSIEILPSKSSIDLSSNTISQQLTAVITPNNSTNKEVEWISFDNDIATVDENGLVTATRRKEGTVTIAAVTKDGSNIQKTAEVTVLDSHTEGEDRPVENIEILPELAIIDLASNTKSLQLATVVTPISALNREVEWSCSNEEVAIVDERGKVIGLCEGEVIITAKAKDGSNVTARRKVTIIHTPNTDNMINATEIEVLPESAIIDLSSDTKTQMVTAVVKPTNATSKEVIWRSSNEEIAEIDATGKVTGLSVGKVTITAIAKYNKEVQATSIIQVVNSHTSKEDLGDDWEAIEVEKIEILPELAIIDLASTTTTLQLVTQVEPSSATNKDVEWSSSDESIGTVDENGLVTGLREGEVIVTAVAKDGSGATASRKVTIIHTPRGEIKPVTKLEVLPKESTIDLSSRTHTQRLVVTVVPQDASNKEVIWRSSDDEVAEVDSEGVVTGLKEGIATITAIAKYTNEVQATAKVTVVDSKTVENKNVEKIQILPSMAVIDLASMTHTQALAAVIKPDNATNKEVTWSSGDTEIGIVDENGVVTGLKVGEVYITAKAKDGSGIKATRKVIVIDKKEAEEGDIRVIGVVMEEEKVTMKEGEEKTLKANIKPENAGNKDLLWASEDESVATVDANGLVKAIKEGKTVVTVMTVDGSYTATCEVTVVKGEPNGDKPDNPDNPGDNNPDDSNKPDNPGDNNPDDSNKPDKPDNPGDNNSDDSNKPGNQDDDKDDDGKKDDNPFSGLLPYAGTSIAILIVIAVVLAYAGTRIRKYYKVGKKK